MKKFLLFVLSLSGCLFLNSAFAAAKHEQALDGIVAVVNDSVITESELQDAEQLTKKQLTAQNITLPPEEVLRKHMLDQLINRKLQMMLAQQANIDVDAAKVDAAIHHIAAENHLTVSQLYEQLQIQGLTVADYRKEIHDQIIMHILQEHEVGSKVTITPQEVEDFMRSKAYQATSNKEYHLEDILIALPEAPTSDQIQVAKKHALALLDQIHRGMSFRAAALTESSGNKALQGGDLGWRKLAEIPSAFADHLMNASQGDIAGPIETPNGIHLVRLAGVRYTGAKTPATQQQVKALLFERKMDEGTQSWLNKLRSEAFINTNP